jgi:hypothetical protein
MSESNIIPFSEYSNNRETRQSIFSLAKLDHALGLEIKASQSFGETRERMAEEN